MLYYRKYEVRNGRAWAILVHGAGGSSSLWFKQIKAFQKNFNVLMVDLRGHGRSKDFLKALCTQKFTMNDISRDILEVMDYENIEKAHFVGLSLGSIIIRHMAEIAPHRILSLIMGGAVINFTIKSQTLVKVGNFFKAILPYMWLYKLLALAIMPRKSNKESRILFIREAKKIGQKEFLRWYKLISEMNPLLKFLQRRELNIPTLYIMGEHDYLFLEPVRQLVQNHKKTMLKVIENCGHVCNVEAPEVFNNACINFIKKHSLLTTKEI